MKYDKKIVNSLEAKVKQKGSMDKLMPDSAQSKIITRAKDMLIALFIDEWKSEAFHQHQNYAERRCQTVK